MPDQDDLEWRRRGSNIESRRKRDDNEGDHIEEDWRRKADNDEPRPPVGR